MQNKYFINLLEKIMKANSPVFVSILILIAILSSCNEVEKKEVLALKRENHELKKRIDSCQGIIAELKNTPERRLLKIQALMSDKNYRKVETQANLLITKYPASGEAKSAKLLKTQAVKTIKAQQVAEERKRLLGFKILKPSTKIQVGATQLYFTKVSYGSSWTFDSYGDKYHYRSADRGSKYLLVRVSISSEINNPSLPPIYAYVAVKGNLTYAGTMSYEFVRWEDYATYLGNYHDYGNDFAKTKTIRFSLGLSITETQLNNNAVFIVVGKRNCFSRAKKQYGNPPVYYLDACGSPKPNLIVNDFESGFRLVKIFNKQKL